MASYSELCFGASGSLVLRGDELCWCQRFGNQSALYLESHTLPPFLTVSSFMVRVCYRKSRYPKKRGRV